MRLFPSLFLICVLFLLFNCVNNRIEPSGVFVIQNIIDISQDGNFAIYSSIDTLEQNIQFKYSVIRINSLIPFKATTIDSLPDNLLFASFCGASHLVFLTDYKLGKKLVIQDVLNPDSIVQLISCEDFKDCPDWFWNSSRIQLNLLDSILVYSTEHGITGLMFSMDGSTIKMHQFANAFEARFSNDGTEILITMTQSEVPINFNNTIEDIVVSYDLMKQSNTVLFNSNTLGGPTPPSSYGLNSPVYFLSYEDNGKSNNLWCFNRTDSTFERLTKFEYPENVSNFYLTDTAIIYGVTNLNESSRNDMSLMILPIN